SKIWPVFTWNHTTRPTLPETGDVLTMIPPPSDKAKPVSIQVRHVYNHFSEVDKDTDSDPDRAVTSTVYFSYQPTDEDKTDWPTSSTHVAVWPGWNAHFDVLMPYIAGFDPAWGMAEQTEDDGTISTDDQRRLTLLRDGNGNGLAVTIDHLQRGNAAWQDIHIQSVSPDPITAEAAKDADLIPEAEFVFDGSDASSLPEQGGFLARIGGEVVALEATGSNQRYRLIGRGLLGSHRTALRPGMHVESWQHFAPVLRLTNQPAIGDKGRLFLHSSRTSGNLFDTHPPALLLADPGGEAYELIANVPADGAYLNGGSIVTDVNAGGTRRPAILIAPWLRALYNGSELDALTGGEVTSSENTLVIPWWPRMPSLLPSGSLSEELLRSRIYPFASFPLRRRGMLLGNDWLTVGAEPESVPGTAPSLRALVEHPDFASNPFDWTRAASANTPGEAREALGPAYRNIPVDGVELRVHWRYTDGAVTATEPAEQLHGLMQQAGRAPRLGPVRMRAQVPTVLLDREQL
ncbi:MAG: hypothetical protein ACOCXA_07965, partial [Planctomycetota bacterium]